MSIEYFFIVILIIIVVSEVLYWLDKHKWGDLGRWSNTLLKKAESLFESSIIIVNVHNVLVHYQDMLLFFGEQQDNIKLVLGFVGYGTIAVLFVLGLIWLNSLKFKEKESKKKQKKKKK